MLPGSDAAVKSVHAFLYSHSIVPGGFEVMS